jgi:hypothetical protein
MLHLIISIDGKVVYKSNKKYSHSAYKHCPTKTVDGSTKYH